MNFKLQHLNCKLFVNTFFSAKRIDKRQTEYANLHKTDDILGICFLHITFEPPHGKTNNLHMRKQRRLCFRYMDSTLPLLLKSEIASF